MKGILTLKKSTVVFAICMAVLCLPGYSEPTPEQEKERTELLIQAIENNNVERAKLCIKLGANVNAPTYRESGKSSLTTYKTSDYNVYTYTVLIYAVEYNKSKDIIELLIKSGADVNANSTFDKTALMFAAKNGNKDVADLLIKVGADVNAKDYFDYTALMFAAIEGHKDIVGLLINSSADVNAMNKYYYCTALMLAAENGYKDVVELLIKAGADVDAGFNSGFTALRYAVFEGHKDVVELLIKSGADVNAKDKGGLTALISAVNNGRKNIAELLVKAGADSKSTLSWAVENNEYDAVRLIVELGADINAKDSEGISPLTYAMLYGRNDIEKFLRAAGAKE